MALLFEFVKQFSPELANLAERIEDKMFTEPHASMMQARLFSEQLLKLISQAEELEAVYPLKQAERIHKLYRQNLIDEDLYLKLEWIRKKGNKAIHDVTEVEVADMVKIHKFLFKISIWYMQVYVSYNFEAPDYQLPTASVSTLWKEKDRDERIKPYVDKKFDDMWSEIHRQLRVVEAEKSKTVADNMVESGNSQIEKPLLEIACEKSIPKTFEVSEEIHRIFTQYNFTMTNKTTKAAEYQRNSKNEIIYLLPNKRLSIVLHPETAVANFGNLEEPIFSTAYRHFPKKINKGKIANHYGYPFKFDSEEGLNDFLQKISVI